MITPNIECYFLCQWMLTVFVPRLTGSQITLTNTIQSAALAQTTVTDQEWKDFCRIAQWRNPYYIVYRDYQNALPIDLNDGLTNFYKFEGNSNDSVGSINGTDTGISYSSLYGKIGQGASANNTASKIVLGANSDFTFVQNSGIFSFNIWHKALTTTGGFYPIGSASSFAHKGFWFQMVNGDLTRVVVLSGTGSSTTSPLVYLSAFVTDTNYNMYTITGDGSWLRFYKNAQLFGRAPIAAFGSGNSTNALQLFAIPSLAGSSGSYIDLFGVWNKALNINEIFALYNGGAGLDYPF